MSICILQPPGAVSDLTDENEKKWSKRVSELMEKVKVCSDMQFYDASQIPEGRNPGSRHVSWLGFPRTLTVLHPINEERWRAADHMRSNQGEYFEWSVKRNQDNQIIRIVFSSELPEYFDFLGRVQPDTLHKLYQDRHPGEIIQKTDLFKKQGQRLVYNRYNRWNTSTETGNIMHLVAPGSTLAALMDIIGRAAITYKDADGEIVTNADRLATYTNGDRRRNSDIVLGAAANALARNGDMLTVENPAGIYIDSINLALIQPPDCSQHANIADFFKFTRGNTRLECEVPEEKGFVLGDLNIAGEKLRYGAQLAELIFVSTSMRMFTGERRAIRQRQLPNGVPHDESAGFENESDNEKCQ
ncbi:unnamed protein product [Rhizoctonia solani]|uniref:Uncharacterized protein n=1 Tax=Rhizoctonia solani TaxID=456999 RepID=A0A8H3GKR2_9AGAM|nr:unnamed protein product [Rhizoctonia solani]